MKRKIKLLLKISLLASPALMIYSCSTQNKSVDSDNEIKVFSEKVSKTIDENFSESALSDRVFDYSKANTIHVLANDLKDNPENAETYIPLILMAIAEANGSTKILSLTAIFDQVKFGVSSKNIVSSFVVNEEEKSYMRISGIY